LSCRIGQIANRALILSVAILGFATEGCSAPTPTALPANEVIAHAAQNFGAVQSLHFVIDFSGSPTYLDAARTMILRHIEGDVVRPDRMRALLKVSLPGVFVQIAAIGIGDQQYATDPLNNKWQQIPTEWGFNPSVLFANDSGLQAILGDIRDPSAMSDESIDGQGHYHLSGKAGATQIGHLVGSLATSGDLAIDLWVGENDLYLRRVKLVELQSGDATPATWLMQLSDFNKPVGIEPPPQFTPLAQ
jgi:hypothetical protein